MRKKKEEGRGKNSAGGEVKGKGKKDQEDQSGKLSFPSLTSSKTTRGYFFLPSHFPPPLPSLPILLQHLFHFSCVRQTGSSSRTGGRRRPTHPPSQVNSRGFFFEVPLPSPFTKIEASQTAMHVRKNSSVRTN